MLLISNILCLRTATALNRVAVLKKLYILFPSPFCFRFDSLVFQGTEIYPGQALHPIIEKRPSAPPNSVAVDVDADVDLYWLYWQGISQPVLATIAFFNLGYNYEAIDSLL